MDSRAGLPATMRAVRFHRFGGPEVLQVETVPIPRPRPGEVLVQVKATSVNPVDWKLRAGLLTAFVQHPFPVVPGVDIAGTVVGVGPGAGDLELEVGTDVFGATGLESAGGYAQYVAVPAERLATVPEGLTYRTAAAIPTAGATAWKAIFDPDAADLRPGQSVLIHGAAGGVGHLALQLAVWHGGTAYATASPGNHDYLLELGATRVIDYHTARFEDELRDLDAVVDLIGGEVTTRSIRVLRPGGTLVAAVPGTPSEADIAAATAIGVRAQNLYAELSLKPIVTIARLAAEGILQVTLSQTLTLDQVAAAHRESEHGHTRGKIILEPFG